MQELLKMIESVDPNDGGALDEIDARVWCLVRPYIFVTKSMEPYGENNFNELKNDNNGKGYYWCNCFGNKKWPPKYTRSRDALKSIRPDGWSFQMFGNSFSGEPTKNNDLKYYAELSRDNPYQSKTSPDLPTEELAELWCIVSAIQWERDNDK